MPEVKHYNCIDCEGWVGEPSPRHGMERRYCPRFNTYTSIADYCNGGPSGKPSLSSKRDGEIADFKSQSMDGKRPVRYLPLKCPTCGDTYEVATD